MFPFLASIFLFNFWISSSPLANFLFNSKISSSFCWILSINNKRSLSIPFGSSCPLNIENIPILKPTIAPVAKPTVAPKIVPTPKPDATTSNPCKNLDFNLSNAPLDFKFSNSEFSSFSKLAYLFNIEPSFL